jgi:hypothetical protein
MDLRQLAIAAFVLVVSCASVAAAAQGDCSQPVTNGTAPAASDCLFILRTAIGSQTCTPECVCNPTGDASVSATDALLCLKKAVGQSVTLSCPCATTTTTIPPPLDVWQPTTVPFDPTCSQDCEELETTELLPHTGTEVRFLYDAAVDDPVAQWGDCLASMLSCLRNGTGVRACAADATCPSPCKDLFEARAPLAADEPALLDVLNGVYVDATAPCRPAGARP